MLCTFQPCGRRNMLVGAQHYPAARPPARRLLQRQHLVEDGPGGLPSQGFQSLERLASQVLERGEGCRGGLPNDSPPQSSKSGKLRLAKYLMPGPFRPDLAKCKVSVACASSTSGHLCPKLDDNCAKVATCWRCEMRQTSCATKGQVMDVVGDLRTTRRAPFEQFSGFSQATRLRTDPPPPPQAVDVRWGEDLEPSPGAQFQSCTICIELTMQAGMVSSLAMVFLLVGCVAGGATALEDPSNTTGRHCLRQETSGVLWPYCRPRCE